MVTYRYLAKTASGSEVRGTVNAVSHRSAIVELSRQGYYPMEVVPQTSERRTLFTALMGRRRLGAQLLANFYRNLADLLGSGVTIPGAMEALVAQNKGSALGKVIDDILTQLHNGLSLSEALARHHEIIPRIDSRIIIAGEAGGKLEEALTRLANQKETEHDIKSRIKTAFAYPVLLVIASSLVVTAFTLFVVPNLMALVANTGQQLPLVTRVVIGSTQLMIKIGWLPILLILISVVLKRPRLLYAFLRRLLSRLSLRLPVLRDVIIKSEMMKFARTLESLLRNGVSILSSWELSCSALANAELRATMAALKTDIEQGQKIGSLLTVNKQVPAYVATAVSVGEESNRLESALSNIAETYERELDRSIRLLTTVLEPIMILIVGAAVGILIISLLLPIFQLEVGGF